MKNFKNKKAIIPVVAISLLLVVSVMAVVAFSDWYKSFYSSMLVDIEKQNSASSSVSVLSFVGSNLYIKSNGNTSISSITINGVDCNFNGSVLGITSINVSSCSENVSGVASIVVVTENKIIESYKYLPVSGGSLSSLWLNGWNYRVPIVVNNSYLENISALQIEVTIDTMDLITNNKLNSLCSDIRFTDNSSNLLDFWIESGCNTSLTKIWVKLPDLESMIDFEIYFYYGNENSVYASSGSNTFLLFDDFNDNLINNSIWTYLDPTGGLTTQEISGVLRRSGTPTNSYVWNNLDSVQNFDKYRILDYKIKVNTHSGGQAKILPGTGDLTLLNDDSTSGWEWQYYSSGWNKLVDSSNLVTGGVFIDIEVIIKSTGYYFSENGVYVGSRLLTISEGINKVSFRTQMYHSGNSFSADIDDIVVRKYVANFPSISFGSEISY